MKAVLCIETCLYYVCILLIARQVFQKEFKTRWHFIITIILMVGFVLLSSQASASIFHTIVFALNQVFVVLLIKWLFRNIKIISIIYIYITLFFINAVSISFALKFLPKDSPYNLWIDFAIHTLTAVFCIMICFGKHRYKIQQFVEWIPSKIKGIVCIIFLIEAVLVTIFFDDSFFGNNAVWYTIIEILLTVFILVLCLALPLLIAASVSKNRLKKLTDHYEQQIRTQAEHYKRLAATDYEHRQFRHDFKNTRIAIEAMLAANDTEGALKLMREYNRLLEDPCDPVIAFDTGNGIADALLSEKQRKALACGAFIRFEGAIPTDSLSPTDLCVILGNTLDNAVEACEKLPPDLQKSIILTCRCCSGYLFITVTNPVAAKVTIHQNHIVTTKENKTLHGFGLYSLETVVKRGGGRMVLSSTDDLFTVDIDLCLTPVPSTLAHH